MSDARHHDKWAQYMETRAEYFRATHSCLDDPCNPQRNAEADRLLAECLEIHAEVFGTTK